MPREIFPHSEAVAAIGLRNAVGWQIPRGMSEDQWRAAGLMLARSESSFLWQLGDWWSFGESHYGDRTALLESRDWQGPSLQTCQDAGWVARTFGTSRRREVLSFSHHREAASLAPGEADDVLSWAESPARNGNKPRSTRELREEIRRRKDRQSETDIKQLLMERHDERRQRTPTMRSLLTPAITLTSEEEIEISQRAKSVEVRRNELIQAEAEDLIDVLERELSDFEAFRVRLLKVGSFSFEAALNRRAPR